MICAWCLRGPEDVGASQGLAMREGQGVGRAPGQHANLCFCHHHSRGAQAERRFSYCCFLDVTSHDKEGVDGHLLGNHH